MVHPAVSPGQDRTGLNLTSAPLPSVRWHSFFYNPGISMRRPLLLSSALLVLLSACSGGAGGPAALDTDDQKASYALGLDLGSQFAPTEGLLDVAAFTRGFREGLTDVDPSLDPAELQPLVQEFSQRVREQQMESQEAEAETNRQEGEAYLAENAARAEVTVTDSGLQYEVLEQGDGPTPSADDEVTIHYRGTLVDGTEFDSSYGGDPATFSVGGVIPGFSEGLQLMPVGSTYRLVIPSDMAYGPRGSGGAIGPDETLIFEVEMLEIAGG